MKISYNMRNAKDMLISLANKLPSNLYFDEISEVGRFTKNFLLELNEVQLSALNAEAQKQGNEKICLLFYSNIEDKSGKLPSKEIENFTAFDFSKVVKILFNGNTAPLLKYFDSDPVHYVSVTLILKD